MKKVDYKEIVNLLNSSDIEIIKLGLSYLLDLNLIKKETFQKIIEKYNSQIWSAEGRLDLVICSLRNDISEFKEYKFKIMYGDAG